MYQAIPLTKPRFTGGKFVANGYTFVHQKDLELQFTVSIVGFGIEFMSPVYAQLIEGFPKFQAEIHVRNISASKEQQEVLVDQSFQESMRDPETVYAGLPAELREKMSLEDWKKAAQGIAGLLDQHNDARKKEKSAEIQRRLKELFERGKEKKQDKNEL